MGLIKMFTLFPIYALIHVQEVGEVTFFTDWTEQEMVQGFAWAPSGVSFQLPRDRIDVDVTLVELTATVVVSERFTALSESVLSIRVPFDVTSSKGIVVSDLFSDGVVEIKEGKYALYFETGYTPSSPPLVMDSCWCQLTFVESLFQQEVRVLRTPGLNVPLILRSKRVSPP